MGSTSEGVHALGVTTDGRLWHKLAANLFTGFADVETVGVGQDVGQFTAVTCS